MDNLITGDLKNIEHLFKLENFEFYHHDITKFVHVPGQLIISYTFASPKSYRLFKIPIQTQRVLLEHIIFRSGTRKKKLESLLLLLKCMEIP
jgi:hypothetical protein